MKEKIQKARLGKKIVALLLTFAMVLGVAQGIAIQVDATDITYDLSDETFEVVNTSNKYDSSGNPTSVYVRSTTYVTSMNEGVYYPADDASGVFLGDKEITNDSSIGIQVTSKQYIKITSNNDTATTDGTNALVVKGMFANTDGKTIKIPELKLTYDATNTTTGPWTVEKVTVDTETVTVDMSGASFSAINKNSTGENIIIETAMVTNAATNTSEIQGKGLLIAADEDSGIWVGNTRLTSNVGVRFLSDGTYWYISGNGTDLTTEVGTIVTVKGTFTAMIENVRYVLKMPEWLFEYTGVSGALWEKYVAPVTVDMSSASFSAINKNSTEENIIIETAMVTNAATNTSEIQGKGLLTAADEDSGIWVGATHLTSDVGVKLLSNGEYWYISGNGTALATEVGTIVTVKGTFTLTKDEVVYTLKMPEWQFEYTGVSGALWVKYVAPVTVDMSGASFSAINTNSTVEDIIIETAMVTNAATNTSEIQGKGLLTAADEDSGIWVGATHLTSDVGVKLLSNGEYWYISGNGTALATEVGTIVTVKGTFTLTKDEVVYTLKMPEWQFEYTGVSGVLWVKPIPTGDFNGDYKENTCDLVRLKRHIIDSTVTITSDVTYNDDSEINFEDVDDLRWALVADYSYDIETGLPIGTPIYSSDGLIERMAYSGPTVGTWTGDKYASDSTFASDEMDVIDENFQKYKATGFTIVSSRGVADWYSSSEDQSGYASTVFDTFMKAAERNGLKAVVNLRYVDVLRWTLENNEELFESNCVQQNGSDYSNSALGFTNYYQYIIYNRIINYIGIDKYPAIAGFIVGDEWTADEAELYNNIIVAIKAAETTLIQNGTITDNFILVTSQYPITVYDDGVDDKSGTEILTGSTDDETNATDAYQTYLEEFAGVNRMFTYDLYPLWYKVTEEGMCLNDDWFTNLELVAEYAKERGFTKTGVTVQSCKIEGRTELMYQYAPTTETQIGFQMYTALAYGMKSINYFCYNQSSDSSVTDNITNNSAMYTAVKTVNDKVSLFDHVLVNYQWKGALDLTGATGYGGDANSGRLASATVSGARTIIGCMKDKFGFDGYMLANAAEPNTTTAASVTLTFANADKAVVYVDGVPTTIELTDSSITIAVPVGSGVFVIPVKSN